MVWDHHSKFSWLNPVVVTINSVDNMSPYYGEMVVFTNRSIYFMTVENHFISLGAPFPPAFKHSTEICPTTSGELPTAMHMIYK